MFVTNDEQKIEWYWSDGKMHDISIVVKTADAEEVINLKDLYDDCNKIMEQKEDLCKNIYYLGLSLTGSSSGGWGFLMGWLIRSIKNDATWNIQHTEKEVSDEEVIEHLATLMEKSIKMLREQKDKSSLKGITPTIGSTDGTDLFSK